LRNIFVDVAVHGCELGDQPLALLPPFAVWILVGRDRRCHWRRSEDAEQVPASKLALPMHPPLLGLYFVQADSYAEQSHR
jgi:hypothetical protein